MGNDDDKKRFQSQVGQGRSDASNLYDQFLGVNRPAPAPVNMTDIQWTNRSPSLSPPAGQAGRSPWGSGGTTLPSPLERTGAGVWGERDEARTRATDLYNTIYGFDKDLSETGGIRQSEIDRLRGIYDNPSAYGGSSSGGGGGGGIGFSLGPSAFEGINIPGFAESLAGFRDFSRTGGVDLAKLEEALGMYRGLTGEQGGFSGSRLAGIQGDTGRLRNADYSQVSRDELLNQERTGGYSEDDIAAIRRKAASSGSSIYSSLADQLGREKAVTGFNPGMSGQSFKLARQAAQDAANANMTAGIGLGDSIRQGKYQASSRLADLELAKLAEQRANLAAASGIDIDTQSLIDSTRLAAMGGIQQGQFQNQSLISGNRLAGLGGLRDTEGLQSQLEMSRAGGLDSYNLNRAGLELSASAAGSSQRAMDAYQRAQMEQWLMGQQQSGRIAGVDALTQLYGTRPGEVSDYNRLILDTLGQRDASQYNWTALNQPQQGRGWQSYASTAADIAGVGVDIWDKWNRRNQPPGGGTQPGGPTR